MEILNKIFLLLKADGGEDNHLYKHGGSCYYCGGFS